MRGYFNLKVGLFLLFLALHAGAQEDVPPPTATPVHARLHYSYNHVIPVGVYEHEDVCFSVFVDQLFEGDDARIHFRENSSAPLHMMVLGYNQADGSFSVCIDERYHDNSNFQYYIELFPVGLSPVRIPEAAGEFYSVKIKKKSSRYIEPILMGLLILSPAVAAFLYSKIRKVHSKRRAEYENRLRSRRRKLHKEREKHYNEYLKTLSGRKVAAPQSKNGQPEDKSSMPEKSAPIPQQLPPTEVVPKQGEPASGAKKPAAPKTRTADLGDTDKELRRELDSILNVIATDTPVVPAGSQKKPSVRPPVIPKPAPRPSSPKRPVIEESDDLSDEDKQKLLDLFDEK